MDVLNSSVEFYEKALKLDPTFLNLYSNYGNVLMLIGELKKAKLIFLQGLKIEPHNSILTYNLANLYEREKDYENAISFFSITIKNNPKFYQAHNNLATLLLKPTVNTLEYEIFLNTFVDHLKSLALTASMPLNLFPKKVS